MVRNQAIGFVFQDHCLLPQCSVLENVLIPTLVVKDRDDYTLRARELLAQVGLGDRLDHRPAELSGGEKQRAALARALIRPPYRDGSGCKWLGGYLFGAQPHAVNKLHLRLSGWPQGKRPLRIVFLSDFHCGSHADDLARLRVIVSEAASHQPDLALFGGDFVNMQLFGGGRVPPRVTAAILAQLSAPLGQLAVLGNHDYTYGMEEVADALREQVRLPAH